MYEENFKKYHTALHDMLQKGISLLVVILGPFTILRVHCTLFGMLVGVVGLSGNISIVETHVA